MMTNMNIDPRVREILQQHLSDLPDGEKSEVLWEVRRGRTSIWVIYHKYVELIARNAGVQIQEINWLHMDPAEKTAVCQVLARLGDAWTITTGEAAPYNNKNTYPVAMAEKRGVDRAVLKLVGLHGLVYSDDEADDFKEEGRRRNEERAAANPPTRRARRQAPDIDDLPDPDPPGEDVTVTSNTVEDGLPFDEPEPARPAQYEAITNLIRRVRLDDSVKADGYAKMADEVETAKDAAGLIRRIQNHLRKYE